MFSPFELVLQAITVVLFAVLFLDRSDKQGKETRGGWYHVTGSWPLGFVLFCFWQV